MKVYIATSGEYSDYRVVRVFAREEDAEAYELADCVEEFEFTEGPVEIRTWNELQWDLNERHEPVAYTKRREFDGQPRNVQHRFMEYGGRRQALIVDGWDLTRIRKTFSEQRAQYVAMRHLELAQRDAEIADRLAKLGRLDVRVTHMEFADAALHTPLHPMGRPLLIPALRITEQAGLEPGTPLPRRWFTVQTLTLDTADGFSVCDDPNKDTLAK